jgi:hypothetical protein
MNHSVHQSKSASVILLNQQLNKTDPIDTFLGDLVVLADNMISSYNPDIFLEFPRISKVSSSLYSGILQYIAPEEYTAFLSNEEQLTLVLLILQSEGVPYEYHTLES